MTTAAFTRAAVLKARVDEAEADERRQALRLLLQKPLLHRGIDADAFTLVRRHEVWLRAWLQAHPGWQLQGDATCLRLRKTPSQLLPPDSSHPARDPKHGLPFTRRRYVCCCLALVACEEAGRQITLGRLAEDIQAGIELDPVLRAAGITLDMERRSDRGDLVAVGRLLLDWGLLERIQGSEDRFLAGGDDCLYTIHRPVLARLPALRQGPSTIVSENWDERLRALQHEPSAGGGEEQRRLLRQGLVRALLEQPVLRYDELGEEAAAYLRSQQGGIVAELCQATGLHAEQRHEGIALVDDSGQMMDFALPKEGTDGHAALLLAEHCATRLREGVTSLPLAELEALIDEAARRHARLWRNDTGSAEGARQLCHDLIDRLASLRLLRRDGAQVIPLPPIARYALREEGVEDEIAETEQGEQLDLFS